MRKRVVVTGAAGFIGRHLTNYLARLGFEVAELTRQNWPKTDAEWRRTLSGADAVVHLAGIAHRTATVDEYLADNSLTAMLSDLAKALNVRRFVYISSIAAQSAPISPSLLTENDEPRPETSYGKAKLSGERIVQKSGCHHTILRPVAVYGPGAEGNPGLLQKLARLPAPLPLGSIKAKRSLVSVGNLVSAIEFVLNNESAINQTFIVADPEPETVGGFIARLRRKAGKPAMIIPFPSSVLRLAFSAIGRADMWDRITGSLVASPDKLVSIGWAISRAER